MFPEHEGQLRGDPVRSFAIRCRACAGLNVAGRGLRMCPPKVLQIRLVPETLRYPERSRKKTTEISLK